MTSAASTESGRASKAHETTVENECATNKEASTTIAQPPRAKKTEEKYCASERRVGEFACVDQNNVQVSMKNGIIGVVLKAQKHESRKTTIS